MTSNFHYPIRVYYEDTDAGGVVYYANYLKFIERARTEWLRHLGFELDQLQQQQQCLFVVRQVHIDYIKPAHFNQQLNTISSLQKSSKVSWQLKQQVYFQQTCLCEAQVKLVCVHSETLKPRAIPDALQKAIKHGN